MRVVVMCLCMYCIYYSYHLYKFTTPTNTTTTTTTTTILALYDHPSGLGSIHLLLRHPVPTSRHLPQRPGQTTHCAIAGKDYPES